VKQIKRKNTFGPIASLHRTILPLLVRQAAKMPEIPIHLMARQCMSLSLLTSASPTDIPAFPAGQARRRSAKKPTNCTRPSGRPRGHGSFDSPDRLLSACHAEQPLSNPDVANRAVRLYLMGRSKGIPARQLFVAPRHDRISTRKIRSKFEG
jgi:hypothetical protein